MFFANKTVFCSANFAHKITTIFDICKKMDDNLSNISILRGN